MNEQIYFSLYKGVPEYYVRIFQSAQWTLGNGVNLEINIIGKSHRVISRLGDNCLTEFVTCFDHDLPEQALESVCLQPGIIHDCEYRSGNLTYRVNVEHVSQLFNNMKEFTGSLGKISETLTHEFVAPLGHSEAPLPFTGLALNSDTNTFYTIHSYPERGISIISRTSIYLTILSSTT